MHFQVPNSFEVVCLKPVELHLKCVNPNSERVCCCFSFCQIRNGEQKSYMLKNKELTGPTKGVIYLEIEVIYNTVSGE